MIYDYPTVCTDYQVQSKPTDTFPYESEFRGKGIEVLSIPSHTTWFVSKRLFCAYFTDRSPCSGSRSGDDERNGYALSMR